MNNVQDNGARALNVAMFVLSAAVGSANSGHLDGTDNAGILLSMVDAKNGNVLWCNHFFTSSGMMRDMFKGDSKEVDTKRIDQLLSGALETLPHKRQLLDKVVEAD